jgi:hypothetical protein
VGRFPGWSNRARRAAPRLGRRAQPIASSARRRRRRSALNEKIKPRATRFRVDAARRRIGEKERRGGWTRGHAARRAEADRARSLDAAVETRPSQWWREPHGPPSVVAVCAPPADL